VAINKYIPRSLQNIKDRLEAFNESITRKLFSTELEKTFEVTIYTSIDRDTKTPIDPSAEGSPADTSEYFKYKARSHASHHDHLTRPESATNVDEYERLRNLHFQAIIKKNFSNHQFPQLGDVWLATEVGADLVSLTSFQRNENIRLKILGSGTARAAYESGAEPATTAGSYRASRPAGNVPPPIPPPPATYTNNATPGTGIVPKNDGAQAEILKFISEGEGGYNASNNGTASSSSGIRGIINSLSPNSYVSLKTGLVTKVKKEPDQKLLSELTIGEIMRLQGWKPNGKELRNYTYTAPKYRGRNNRVLFAVGRYQVIPATMYSAVKAKKISHDTVFDEDTQDYIALYLIYEKRRTLGDYLVGKHNNLTAAVESMSMEWASVPAPKSTLMATDKGKARVKKKYPNGPPADPKKWSVSYHGNGNSAHHTVGEVEEILKKTRQKLKAS